MPSGVELSIFGIPIGRGDDLVVSRRASGTLGRGRRVRRGRPFLRGGRRLGRGRRRAAAAGDEKRNAYDAYEAHGSRVAWGGVKVHLVDGTYELFRAYYGAPPRKNREGREVGAARALFGSLSKLIRDDRVTHMACAFDHVIESFRNDLFDGYKTGDGIEPDLWNQFELAERVSMALGVVTWPMIEFEADDAIATAAKIAALDSRVEQVLLCSPDKDLAQCVEGDRIVLVDRLRGKRYGERDIEEKFGVLPRSIPDFLALVGDTADGIPGVPGWGEKSTAAILSAYGNIESIPRLDLEWTVKVRGAKRLAENLGALREEVKLYRHLATLRTDVPLGITVDDLARRGPDSVRLEELARELDDQEIIGLANVALQ
jgi:5'-3' exonuclease